MTKTSKQSKKRTLITIAGWLLAAVFIVTTAQAQNERNLLKDQLATKTNPAINHALVIEDPQLEYVNAVRAKHGIAPLQYDDGLLESAKLKTQDMIARHYWSHITPDGKAFNEAAGRTRPGLKSMGENIAQCFSGHKEMYISYEQSPGHFNTMTDPKFTKFGGSTMWDEQAQCFKNTNHFGG